LTAKKHGAPFVAELKPSKNVKRLFIAIHLTAFGASIANALPLMLKLTIAILIGVNFKINFPKLNNERHTIKYTEKLGWEISIGGDFEAVTILKSTVVTTAFIFLQMQDKPTLIIASDALEKDNYRQLIIKLKMTV
jgi:hypothetical protein